MRHFTCVQDLGDLKQALNEAFEIKKDRFQFSELGKNKTLLMIFFNSSLRTRLSTQKAAMNLGMNTIVLDVNQGAWKLEYRPVGMLDELTQYLFVIIIFFILKACERTGSSSEIIAASRSKQLCRMDERYRL